MDDPIEQWQRLSEALIGTPELTPRQVAEQSGITIDDAQRLWRALGFSPVPDDHPAFTRADVETVQTVLGLQDHGVFVPELLIQMTRVTGQSMARIAEAQVSVAASLRNRESAGFQPVELERLGTIAPALLPVLERLLCYVWRRHLLAAAWRQATADMLPSDAAREVVVGFADLVGFTALARKVDDRTLATMIDRFETLAFDDIHEHGGRIIKMIGDEVMFVAEEAETAAKIAFALLSAKPNDGVKLPDLRVGMAIGPVLSQEGDLFGPTVNLASRLVNIARPRTILISPPLATALNENPAFLLRKLRSVDLKGIGRQRVFALRSAETG